MASKLDPPKSFAWAALVAALLAAAAPCAAEDPGPCAGAALLAALLDVNFTSEALPLLDGKESPRLRAHIEGRVASAAAEAREQIAGGASLPPMGIPNLNAGFRQCITYFSMHPGGSRALEDLRWVNAWILAQPRKE